MDEVDFDNVEDLNELEARLYAQVHHQHEHEVNSLDAQKIIQNDGNNQEHHETICSEANRGPTKRYWTSEETPAFKPKPQNYHQSKQQHNEVKHQCTFQHPNQKPQLSIPVHSGQESTRKQIADKDVTRNNNDAESALVDTNINSKSQVAQEYSSNEQSVNRINKHGQPKSATMQKPKHNPNLRLNPVADWSKRNKMAISDKANNKDLKSVNAANTKQGPFFKQQQKMQKIKRVEDKKQKSKKAKEKLKGKKLITTDIIELISSEESDSSDVVMIPIPPPPTFTVEDSDEDENVINKLSSNSNMLQPEENALDSTDVDMSTSSSFIKPTQQTSIHNTSNSDSADKRLENTSRCTSPCSIQSSDDFIGQMDRSRLLDNASGVADDEDLLLLTSDVNSLMEAPQKQSSSKTVDDEAETSDSLAFVPPKANEQSNRNNYRVEQTQFRALDVYESESDITDSVYSKGTAKTTVIRQLDSSSDEVEDISFVHSTRTKRFRKRRASSSNKGSDVNYENTQSSSENSNDENGDDGIGSGTERTGIPFISRGPAVERKIRKNSRTLLSCSPAPHKTFKAAASKGHMSDGDFIAKLNNLVQGQDGDDANEGEESDEAEKAPSARDIAEKILGESSESTTKNTDPAVPKSARHDLSDVFNTIDKMAEKEQEKQPSGDKERDENSKNHNENAAGTLPIVYKTLPTDDKVQIITYVADRSQVDNKRPKRSKNGSPIYNVVYISGNNISSGIGWNSEMRKFYEESWNGENFILTHVWNKMNPDKSLWRIYAEDRFSKSTKRYSNLKCTNCCDFGHARAQCKRPKKPLICYMCGESGHQEPRCPNTICLRCGNKTHVYIKGCNACSFQNRLMCPICKIRGHSIDFCPDKWRRYYSTTEPNAFPRNNIVYNTKKYCSICGQRGHLSDSCRNALNFMEYPPIASTVKSHQKSYNDLSMKSLHGGIPFNLMYEPSQEYTFGLAERTNPEKYYGRFLNAVGMAYLLPRKRRSDVSGETSAKKLKKSSRDSVKLNCESKAPNQVQEISESGNTEIEGAKDNNTKADDTGDTVEVESTVQNDDDIQLNVITPTVSGHSTFSSFKSPNNVTLSTIQSQNPDSDSNYSFSEHFDVPSTSSSGGKNQAVEKLPEMLQDENANAPSSKIWTMPIFKDRPKPREMEELPDFIPLVDSTKNCERTDGDESVVDNQRSDNRRPSGISNKFVAADSDDESHDGIERLKEVGQTDGLPCEAKIYLDQFHTKYLLSLEGRNFLAKSSKECDLKARLDFTTVGHVLVIFGLPSNQDKFQRELLMKYREIADQIAQKNIQSMPNIPKRIDVLIRFLRDDINQLNTNLGNANHLYKRLQYVERQQSKAGFKQADKIRRSLNMILLGQAGLQDGNIHLDKLLLSLKTLINDYKSDDATPHQLRSEISSHWKFIFSSYRHDNYEDLLKTYNNLVLKNRMLKLSIDPLLLGNKLLDTSLTLEQKEKLEQPRTQINEIGESGEHNIVNNQPKTPKLNKRKQITGLSGSSTPPSAPIKTLTTQSQRSDSHQQSNTPSKTKSSATTVSQASRKQQTKIMPPPPFINPEKTSNATVSAAIMQQVSEKWKNTCDTLLKEIAKPPTRTGNSNNVRDSKLPSTFWSRESMRYLDECIPIVSSRPELEEKLKRVQNKSKNGQLSYNDYLAVIKLHTALTGK